jgi:hypothetical protein
VEPGASPCEDERLKGASPTDGARVTLSMDANWNVPLQPRDKQLVLPRWSLGDGIFMHPNSTL